MVSYAGRGYYRCRVMDGWYVLLEVRVVLSVLRLPVRRGVEDGLKFSRTFS